jgi:hypothetical protein
MQQHLFTLQKHTYKVQEGVTARIRSPCRTLWLYKGAPLSSQFIRTEIAGSSIYLGGELLQGKTSLTQERAPLARKGAHRRESLDANITLWRTLESALCWVHSRCLFVCLFPPGCSLLLPFSPLLIGIHLSVT